MTEGDLVELSQTPALGLAGLFIVLWLNVFFIRRVSLGYEVRARGLIARRAYNRVFFAFFLAVTYLALTQLGAITLWTVLLRTFDVVADPIRALLFAGSCYTTVGIVSDIASERWRLLPIFIAISGIFSFALSTTTVLNMAPLFRRAWFGKHATLVLSALEARGIDLAEVEMSEPLRQVLTQAAEKRRRP